MGPALDLDGIDEAAPGPLAVQVQPPNPPSLLKDQS
jgi:hypothetical protein